MIKAKFSVLILLVCCAVSLFGCTPENDDKNIMFDAVIYDRATDWIKENFLIGQPSYNSDTENSSYYVVKDKTNYDTIFDEFPTEIDFDKEMLIVYFFSDIYNGYSCNLKSVKLENELLSIKFLHEMAQPEIQGAPIPPCTSQPTQRCLVVKMTKNDAQTFDILLLYA